MRLLADLEVAPSRLLQQESPVNQLAHRQAFHRARTPLAGAQPLLERPAHGLVGEQPRELHPSHRLAVHPRHEGLIRLPPRLRSE
ncbi:MAG: hypothetical protein Q8L48_03635 [Archangium sp.]|nr:hypothetical protein [Archangium sp.]